MRCRRTVLFAVLSTVVALATAAAAGARSSAATALTVTGPYTRYDAQSFRAVLAGFEKTSPGTTVAFDTVAATDDAALTNAVKAGKAPDVAVLKLPEQMPLLRSLVAAKNVQPIGFASGAMDASYAYTWKALGTVNGGLYALPFKVEDRSAFWYDTALFKRAGVQPPQTWGDFQRVSNRLVDAGIKPLAIGGGDGQSLSRVFANVMLTQQGPAAYDKLVAHQIAWTSPVVKAALKTTAGMVVRQFAGGGAAGADRPHRLVRDDEAFRQHEVAQGDPNLPLQHRLGTARLALVQRLAHAGDRMQAVAEHGGGTLVDGFVRLAEIRAPLRVADDHVLRQSREHGRADLAREGAPVLPVGVLSADAGAGAVEQAAHPRQVEIRRAHNPFDATQLRE